MALVIDLTSAFKDDYRRVKGGNLAEPHQFPYHVDIVPYENDIPFQCGGGLISPHFVLTAGHCLVDANYADLTFEPYNYTEPNRNQRVYSDSFIIHGHLRRRPDNLYEWDAAMIKLVHGWSLSQGVKFLSLPDPNTYYVDQIARIAGKGYFDKGKKKTSKELRWYDPTITDLESCKKMGDGVWIATYHVCAVIAWGGLGVQSVCGGDSGGSLTVLNPQRREIVIVGILSFGDAECKKNKPVVYTKVSRLIEWIRNNNDEIA